MRPRLLHAGGGAQQARPQHRGERDASSREAGVVEEQPPRLALEEFIQWLHEEIIPGCYNQFLVTTSSRFSSRFATIV